MTTDNIEDIKNVGNILKRMRESIGMSQEEVAESFNKTGSWVSRIESGDREIKLISLYKLCKLYGTDVIDVLKEVFDE